VQNRRHQQEVPMGVLALIAVAGVTAYLILVIVRPDWF
jgi:hypothetical protein